MEGTAVGGDEVALAPFSGETFTCFGCAACALESGRSVIAPEIAGVADEVVDGHLA